MVAYPASGNKDNSGGGGNGEGGDASAGDGTGGEAAPGASSTKDEANDGKASGDEPPTQPAAPTTQMARTRDNSAFNPKIKLSGKNALKEYNNGTKLRALLRENDVCDVVSTFVAITPGVKEVSSFLAAFQVKANGDRKPTKWRIDSEYVPDRIRFRLPESVIDTALDELKAGLAKKEEIEVDSDGDSPNAVPFDSVSYDLYKRFIDQLLPALPAAFACCWEFKRVPQSWSLGAHAIYKSNAGALERRFMRWLNANGCHVPALDGFRSVNDCAEHNFVASTLSDQAHRKHREVRIIWYDVKNAFDSVLHDLL
ncbi:hypothetical protein ON010_g11767 [Phytophthora cinnamomi]|nr:hypothetical protein ON010_g11767 [Phytophthora cinnamomi]